MSPVADNLLPWGADDASACLSDLSLISIATPASATPAEVLVGGAAALKCLGYDLMNESLLTYTWCVTSAPAGASVRFSENGTNHAKNTVATFKAAGNYNLTCIVTNGLSSVASHVAVLVMQSPVRGELASNPSADARNVATARSCSHDLQ